MNLKRRVEQLESKTVKKDELKIKFVFPIGEKEDGTPIYVPGEEPDRFANIDWGL